MTPELFGKFRMINPAIAGMIDAVDDARFGKIYKKNLRHLTKAFDFLLAHADRMMDGGDVHEPGDTVEEARMWLKKQIEISYMLGGAHSVLKVRVTPALATALLEINTGNRKEHKRDRVKIKNALMKGQWKHNGQNIIVSISGVLLDGQHRCMEIELTQVGGVSDIRFGIADDAFDTIDVGDVRTAADVLGIDGKVNTTALAATLRLLFSLEHGRLTVDSVIGNDHFSNTDNIEWANGRKNIADCVLIGITCQTSFGMTVAGFSAAAYFIQKEWGMTETGGFFDDLRSGNLTGGSARMKFRDQLLRKAFSSSIDVCANTILAFNAKLKSARAFKNWSAEDGLPAVIAAVVK